MNNIEEKLLSSTREEEDALKSRICVESKKIWKVALPGILARVSSFGSMVVTQSFMGHISELDLAGYALVQTLSVRFVTGILFDYNISDWNVKCNRDTLWASIWSKTIPYDGSIFAKIMVIDFITLTFLLPAFLFGTHIFKLVGEKGDMAEAAGIISLWFIPIAYSFIFSLTIQMYLQAQQKNMIIAWLAATQFVIHVPLSWLFVNLLDWGVGGAMGSLCISAWFIVFGEFLYIFGGWCPDTWKGFTMDAFKDIFPVLKLSVSSGIMLCLEFWYYAILVLLAGYMKNAETAISAFSICLNINAWELMICLGFLGASCIRVANELGRGDAKAVKFSIKVLLSTSLLIELCFFTICLVFGNKIGYLFTNEKHVADAVSDLSVLLSFSILLNSLYPVFSGVAIGGGMQTQVAYINLICFYIIGIPIGVVHGYVAHLQVKGIWAGIICGVLTQTLSLTYMAWKTDWDKEVAKASERLNKWYLKSSDEKKSSSEVA